MSNVQIELNHSAIVALMKSDEIADVCEKEARRMTQAVGIDYKPDIYVGRSRTNAGGYEKGRWKICPKCGEAHPNCKCSG